MAFVMQFSFAQEKTITGTVTSSADGLPLPGVNVIVQGTSRGVQTDFDGNYSIKASEGEVLVFSFLGMKETTAQVGSSNTINMNMEEDVAALEEVVVVAYGTSNFVKSASALVQISAEDIEDRANASVIQNLQGQAAGLNIASPSGQPGADSTIILRGIGSINGNVEPLLVVDGIPVDEDNFRSINPNDIATFSVLKDAAATSIYGNRGANGVIIVTTKKGKKNQALKFRYNSQYGYTELQDANLDLMNSRELLELERLYSFGRGNGLSDAQISAIANQVDTYWTDIFFRRGTTNSHNLSISTGGENSTNFTSLSYFDQEGIFLESSLKRFNFRNNFNGNSENGKLNYGASLSMSFSKTNEIDGSGSNAIFFAPFTAALSGLPYLTAFDPDGSITRDGGIAPGDINAITANQNSAVPYILLNSISMNTDQEEELKLLASFNMDYNFAKNLRAGVQIGADYSSQNRFELLHPESILGPFQVTGAANTQFGGRWDEDWTRDFRFNVVGSLNYNNTFADKHNLDLTGYIEYNKSHLDNYGFIQSGLDPRLLGSGAAFIGGDVYEDLNGDGIIDNGEFPYIPTVFDTTAEAGLFSVFGSMEYDYDGKYGLTGTIRRDNSFRFTDDNQWGTFWSVGARWNINQENFMQDTAFNLLKLRGSYGTAGNQRVTGGVYGGASLTRELYAQGTAYAGSPGTAVNQFANIDLRWEVITQANVGVDFGLWNDKVSGTFDVYQKTTDDLYQGRNLSLINGASGINDNIGSMKNSGFEAELKYRIIDNDDWRISVNANVGYNKNEVEEVASSTGRIFGGGSTIIAEGHPINSFYVVPYAGVNPANGNPLFVKANGQLSETFTDDDRRFTDKVAVPVWTGGFGTNISYKSWELSTQWYWVADVYLNNLDLAQLEETQVLDDGSNRVTSVQNAWQNPGDVTDIPRVGQPFNAIDYINSTDRYLEDASYLRLRNLTLGYNLPKRTLERLPITGLRVFAQGENLVTFTSFRGWDAENGFRTTNRGQYPTPRIYTLGISIDF